jgi:hypothetical protein
MADPLTVMAQAPYMSCPSSQILALKTKSHSVVLIHFPHNKHYILFTGYRRQLAGTGHVVGCGREMFPLTALLRHAYICAYQIAAIGTEKIFCAHAKGT